MNYLIKQSECATHKHKANKYSQQMEILLSIKTKVSKKRKMISRLISIEFSNIAFLLTFIVLNNS